MLQVGAGQAPAVEDLKTVGALVLAELHTQVARSRVGELAAALVAGGDFQVNRLLDLARLLLPEKVQEGTKTSGGVA